MDNFVDFFCTRKIKKSRVRTYKKNDKAKQPITPSCVLYIEYTLNYTFNLKNIYLENNQNLQYIKHSKYRQDSETSNYCFYKYVS